MKKTTKIVLTLVATVTLFGCKNQVKNENIDLSNVENSIEKMQIAQNTAVENLFEILLGSENSDLCCSAFFKELSSARNAFSNMDCLSDDEEELIIENMSEEERKKLIQTAQIYLDEYAEIAKVRIFDEANKPEGLIETDEEIILGDIIYTKLTPEGLSKAYELARMYYSQFESSRGAYLNIQINDLFQAAWPSGKIQFAFDNFPYRYQDDMRKCMKEWENGCGNIIKFQETKSFNWWRNIWWNLGTLRVMKISKKDLSGYTTGQTSPGYSIRPYLYIDDDTFGSDYMLRTFRHELGHAIGLQHEFDRNDRDKYIINDTDIADWSDFSVPGVGRLFISKVGSYDYDSVMNYGGLYCVKESDGTKGRLIQDSDIIYISDGDKAAVKYLYRFGGYYY